MKRILMANDMSKRSDVALRRAVVLAKQFGAELEVLTVIGEMFLEATTSENELFAKQALAAQLAGVPDADVAQITQRVIVDLDFEEIIRRSEELDADLVVLGIHRHKTRELFRGTTAERVVRYGARPVLVVKDPASGPYRRVLVATDLSSHAEAAARTAAQLAPQGEVRLLHAIHRPFIAFLSRGDQNALVEEHRERAATVVGNTINCLKRELGDSAPQFDVKLPEGNVYGAIQAEIAASKPNLLAVGTHGRSGIAHALIGSVAEKFLTDCPIDVLAVKSDR